MGLEDVVAVLRIALAWAEDSSGKFAKFEDSDPVGDQVDDFGRKDSRGERLSVLTFRKVPD